MQMRGASEVRGLDVGVEIAPVGVVLADQPEFPLALPFLHRLLPQDGVADVLVPFGMDQAGEAVFGAELGALARPVLGDARGQVRRYADVERAVGGVGHDIDPAAFHRARSICKSHLPSPLPLRLAGDCLGYPRRCCRSR